MKNGYYTVGDVIRQALLKVGAISYSEGIPDDVANTAIIEMNLVLDDWSRTLMNYGNYVETFNPTDNKGFVTMGTDNTNALLPVVGDIAKRPASISRVNVNIGNITYNIPLGTFEEYTSIPMKNIVTLPQKAFFQQGYPFDILYFYPLLPAGYLVTVVGTPQLGNFQSINDMVVLPAGYIKPLILAVTLALYPTFGQQPDQGIVIQLSSAMKAIKSNNLAVQVPSIRTTDGNRGTHNFWAGT